MKSWAISRRIGKAISRQQSKEAHLRTRGPQSLRKTMRTSKLRLDHDLFILVGPDQSTRESFQTNPFQYLPKPSDLGSTSIWRRSSTGCLCPLAEPAHSRLSPAGWKACRAR